MPDRQETFACVEELLQPLDALLGGVVERRVELRQPHHQLAHDVDHVARLPRQGQVAAAAERETAADQLFAVERLHQLAAEADRKLVLPDIGDTPGAHLDELVCLPADPRHAAVAARIGPRQLVDHDRVESCERGLGEFVLHAGAPRLERGSRSGGGGGSSSRMFRLSRIHVERVAASARDSRFHAASSLG